MEPNRQTETWENAAAGKVYVWKTDRFGNPKDEVVPSGGRFTITHDDRLTNSARAADDSLDVFKNGSLVPVRLMDGTEDAAEIASNPNLMAESELRALYRSPWKKFDATINGITNTGALTRLLEVAAEEDATIRQVDVVKARIETLNPPVAERTTTSVPATQGRAVTP